MKYIKVFLFLLFVSFNSIITFRCGADSIKKKLHKVKVDKSKEKRGLSTDYTPMKFFVDYTYINNQMSSKPTQLEYITSLLDKVINYLSALFSVNHNSVTINEVDIYEYCEIPQYDSNIVNSLLINDIIIFPMINSDLEDEVLAEAWTCLSNEENLQPIAGVVEINPNFSPDKIDSDYYLQTLLLHEISHILGFSSTYFNELGLLKTETKGDNIINYISTPKVLEKAKLHFNCNNIKGIELENQGGEGSAGSHWEARYMLGDYMMSTDYPESVISDITLAYFEDIGYYKVNYYTGGLFRFGKNQGCSFLEQDCVYVGGKRTNFPNEFCTEKEAYFCGSSHLSRGDCYIVEYDKPIESRFRHYSNKKLGGFKSADYCPVSYNYYYEDFDPYYYYPFTCNYGSEIVGNIGETIGDNSLCFETSLTPKRYRESLDEIKNICYRVECIRNEKKIRVYVGGSSFICPGYETILYPNGFNGQVKCPDYNMICTSKIWCNELFDCIEKKSEADLDTYCTRVKKEEPENNGEIYNFFKLNIFTFILLFLNLFMY